MATYCFKPICKGKLKYMGMTSEGYVFICQQCHQEYTLRETTR